MFHQCYKALILLSFILNHQIVCIPFFEQRHGDGIVFIKMLSYEEGCERFIDTLKFGVEGTVVKLDLFDNTWAFDIVVVAVKFKIEDFDARPLFNR